MDLMPQALTLITEMAIHSRYCLVDRYCRYYLVVFFLLVDIIIIFNDRY